MRCPDQDGEARQARLRIAGDAAVLHQDGVEPDVVHHPHQADREHRHRHDAVVARSEQPCATAVAIQLMICADQRKTAVHAIPVTSSRSSAA